MHNGLTQQEAARSLGVSPRLVSKASRLLAEDSPAIPELQEAVRTGEVNIGAAYEVKDQPPEVQEQALDRFRSGEALTFSDAVKAIVAKETESDSTPQPPAHTGPSSLTRSGPLETWAGKRYPTARPPANPPCPATTSPGWNCPLPTRASYSCGPPRNTFRTPSGSWSGGA